MVAACGLTRAAHHSTYSKPSGRELRRMPCTTPEDTDDRLPIDDKA